MPTSSHNTVHKKTCQYFGIENLIIRLLYSHNPLLFIHYNIIKIQAHFQILRSWMGYITGWSTLSSNKRIAFNQEPKLLNTRKHRMNGNWEIITFASNYCPQNKVLTPPNKIPHLQREDKSTETLVGEEGQSFLEIPVSDSCFATLGQKLLWLDYQSVNKVSVNAGTWMTYITKSMT